MPPKCTALGQIPLLSICPTAPPSMLRDEQIQLLQGLPPLWRYCLTGGNDSAKSAFEEGWNLPGQGRSLEDVLRISNEPTPLENWKSRKLIGVGAITGPESSGLLVIDFDGTGSQAVRAFREHFHHYPSELPATLCNVSGKTGRGKVFLRVEPHWWPQLQNRSASWKVDEKVVLEAIWMNGTGTGRQAVICGDHPQSSHQKPLFYRWMEGAGPNDVTWAPAPDWLILGIIAKFDEQIPDSPEERRRAGEQDATPWERLTCWERVQIIEAALPFCPHRDERGSGTYEKVRRILCGMINELGVEQTLDLVTRSEWDKKNDWGNSSAEKTILSLGKSSVSEESRARIGSLFHFAKLNGFQWPSWALPPLEQSELHIDGLKKILNKMNMADHDRAAIAAWVGRARREYGVDADELYRLRLEQYLGSIESKGARGLDTIAQARRKDNVATDVIDGLLGRRVHVIAGGSHSGKTTLACFLSNRVVYGRPVDIGLTRHSTAAPGRVLILTSDCSDEDMVRELALEGISPESCGDRVRICSGATFEDMITIVKTLSDFKPDLVICDCLTSMAVAGVKVGDPSYADPIRLLVRHNGVSWPKCAFLILHHTSRDEPTRFAGTEQIKAAAEELWLYYNPELLKQRTNTFSNATVRHLVFEKSRGGYQGRKLYVDRDGFAGSWSWNNPSASDSNPLEYLAAQFRTVTTEDWRIASEWQALLDLKFHPRSLRRYLGQLVGPVLEEEMRPADKRNGALTAHYRPRRQLVTAALEMRNSKGDGVNTVFDPSDD